MGQMLKAGKEAGEVAGKGRPKKNVPAGYIIPKTSTDIGITRKQRTAAEELDDYPKEDFEKIKVGKKSRAKATNHVPRWDMIPPTLKPSNRPEYPAKPQAGIRRWQSLTN